jgi:hypothetical protein
LNVKTVKDSVVKNSRKIARDFRTVRVRQEICVEHSKETVAVYSFDDYLSGLIRSLAVNIDNLPSLTPTECNKLLNGT